jgi:hypothetical protein
MPARLQRIKKMRGGQKGNQNARTHGFYSSALTPDEISRFWNLISQEHVDPEMAVLRIKLLSLVNHVPRRRVLVQVAMLIVRWSAKKYRLNRSDRAYLKVVVENVLEQYAAISLNQPVESLKQ